MPYHVCNNSVGKIIVQANGSLYNDNKVASADASDNLVVETDGYAASLVSFDANGQGVAPPGNTGSVDSTYVPLNEPVPDSLLPSGQDIGQAFVGWYSEAACHLFRFWWALRYRPTAISATPAADNPATMGRSQARSSAV